VGIFRGTMEEKYCDPQAWNLPPSRNMALAIIA
jgi:hypothetical protein